MKIKEINISANIAWSPEHVTPIYLTCGTSAQQLDTSFGSTSQLALYDLSYGKSSLDMTLKYSTTVPAKFNKVIWNGKSGITSSHPNGIIVGGCDNGSIYIYSADKLIKKQEPLITCMEGKHAGPVYTLDFNYHQANLLATGSKDCEIIIWDINDTSSPMTPGAKPNIAADVTSLAWNRQVEHIMASTYAGRCVVYDLRKSSSIIQIPESVSRIKAHNINWHPDVATQLILGCDDDSAPIAQVWDLRFAAAPLKTIEGHQRGIVATAWCTADPDLFITSAKDNKIYVWNPNNNDKVAEFVGEFPSYNQWSFDVAWCLRDPSLVGTASVDGTVSVYSVMGGGIAPAQASKFSAIADSFPGMEIPTEVPQTVQPQSIHLKHPPKWFPNRSGVSFGFGGRLLSWSAASRRISISQVVTEPELVARSVQLEEALSQSDLSSYCQNKVETSTLPHEKVLWSFIGATFESSFRMQYMSLLGFSPDQIASKVRPEDLVAATEDLAVKMETLGTDGQYGSNSSLDPSEQFEMIASAQCNDKTSENEVNESEITISAALSSSEPLCLSVGEDSLGMIRHSLIIGDYESAVKLCLKLEKTSLALILASHAGPELFNKTRDTVLSSEQHSGISPLVTSVVQEDFYSLVSNCKLSDWKEALVATLTYASDEEFSSLAECLGKRLQHEGSSESLQSAALCFLCSGNLDKFVSCWANTKSSADNGSPDLQSLVEIIVVLQRALSSLGRLATLTDGSEASVYLCHYAFLLSSQGALSSAVSYLNNATQGEMMELRDRLYRALGYQTGTSIAARNRSTSSSSQHTYHRPSTPYQPAQFTPSVQAQQASYGAPPQPLPPFYTPTPPVSHPSTSKPMQPQPTFMQPVPPVVPAFGAAPHPVVAPGPFGQPLKQPPLPPPPPALVASGTLPPGGLRKSVAANRYLSDVAPSGIGMTQPGMFSPASNNPNLMPSHQVQYNPTSVPSMINPLNPATPFMAEQLQQQDDASNHTPAAFDPTLPRGWNDPPALSSSRKIEHSGAKRLQNIKQAKQQQKSQQSSAEQLDTQIMNPVAGMMVPEPLQQSEGFPNMQGFCGIVGQSSQIPGQLSSSATHTSPEPPPPKLALPAEHQVIQDTFNALREKGLQVTANPSAKQRLEDLAAKLEVLYDKLRSGQIGATTTSGIHQIVAAVQVGDYHHALQLHSSTVSSGSFSEMSSFMPAIKLLLTTCMQCQVFLH